MQLSGKVALITGAGSGIGKGAALLMAKEGAKIAALEREAEAAKQTVAQIQETGGEAMPLVADVSRPKQMEKAVQKIVDKWGHLDIVFANAGINGVWAPVEDLQPEEWDETFDVNIKGTFLTVKYAAPHLKKQGGSVIVTSSVNGNRSFSHGVFAYACTKAAQVVFVKCMAVEFAKHGVRINAICPGAIETNIGENTETRNLEHVGLPVEYPEGKQPLSGGKPGTVDQVSQLVLFLASEASNHITGTKIYIDGGSTLV
ncbi:MAG TPA: SDR family NAD(P)-dependent oxidoreductase [Abditibacteriaceae bacterium]|nr:SDR family NAD(P)-dependent oxidoreductase [Abditibacteriaceae bacterium]